MIWDELEKCNRRTLEEVQLQRLQQSVKHAYDNVPFYRDKFEALGINPNQIKSLKDIRHLPFTVKTDLRDNYPYGLFALPRKEIVRLHASSGTTGKPIVVGYSKKDLDTWSNLVARVVTLAGVNDEDIAQISFGYGLFTGGFGLHYGMERVGATVLPVSVGNSRKQVMLMQDFGTTVLVSTPSYCLQLAEVAEEMGIDPKSLPVRLGLFGGEPWSEATRQAIEQRWDMKATDNYGLSEVMGPGVTGECERADGLHIAEDHFLLEVIDPESGKPLEYGQEGELVITTLTKEAMPIIRYRTRDITVLNPEPCACGRTSVRMRRVSGRTDDMLIIRGVNVFPSQIESVLLEVEGVSPNYQLVVDKRGFLDDLEVQVEVPRELLNDHMGSTIRKRLQGVLGISAKITLLEPNTIERVPGKAKRVIDRRAERNNYEH
ncbi:phenylacetate--CoA ligase [Paradesulfitobacterium aromaticivorans]